MGGPCSQGPCQGRQCTRAPEERTVCPETRHPCVSSLVLGLLGPPKGPASLFTCPALSAPLTPQPHSGHEPGDFTEARLWSSELEPAWLGDHHTYCCAVPSPSRPRKSACVHTTPTTPQSHSPLRGGLEVLLPEQGGTTWVWVLHETLLTGDRRG